MLTASLIVIALLQFALVMAHGSYIALAHGVAWGIGRRSAPPATTGHDFGRRIERSIANNVENLAIFLPLVAAGSLLDATDSRFAAASLAFAACRAAFAAIYLLNIPVLRTVVWFCGQAALVVMAWHLSQMI